MRPTVVIVFFSFTGQTRRVAEVMAEAFRELGWQVIDAPVRLTDERYPLSVPWRPFWRRLLGWIPPQVLGRTCGVAVPPDVSAGAVACDLVCIGSPTWWLLPAMPLTSFLRDPSARRLLDGRPFAVFAVARAFWRLNAWRVRTLARRCGGRHLASRGFVFPGNQLQSFATLASYLRTGVSRERWWGVPLYPYGLTPDALRAARAFATELAAGTRDAVVAGGAR